MNGPETDTPDVLQAEWDLEQIDALFSDLKAGAEVQHVQVRTATPQQASDHATTLDDAHTLLKAGQAKAIQIRYVFEGGTWCDTLMVEENLVRIIRTAVPSS